MMLAHRAEGWWATQESNPRSAGGPIVGSLASSRQGYFYRLGHGSKVPSASLRSIPADTALGPAIHDRWLSSRPRRAADQVPWTMREGAKAATDMKVIPT